jgi:hypothetical protein
MGISTIFGQAVLLLLLPIAACVQAVPEATAANTKPGPEAGPADVRELIAGCDLWTASRSRPLLS